MLTPYPILNSKVSTTVDHILKENLDLHRVIKSLADSGGKPFLVGGTVRDILLDKSPEDFDIEVYELSLKQVQESLEAINAKKDQVGKKFAVFKIGTSIDISLPRQEMNVGEKHTDFDIIENPYLDTETATRRRDLTINAILYSFDEKQLVDHFEGIPDLKNKVLRYVDKHTFIEDPLRVYRIAQFAARFGFTIEGDTRELATLIDLNSLPMERINHEFQKMLLKSDKPSIGLQALDDMQVLDRYFPEIAILKTTPQRSDYHAEGNVFLHTQMVLDKAATIIKRFDNETDKIIIMLAALAHDLGKPLTTEIKIDGCISQHGHEKAGIEPARKFLAKLTNETNIIDNVLFLVAYHLTPATWYRAKPPDKSFVKFINKHGIKKLELLSALSEADMTGRIHREESGTLINNPTEEPARWFWAQVQRIAKERGTYQEKIAPLIKGQDLLDIGFAEGKLIGEILKDVVTLQEDDQLQTKEEALIYVKKKYADRIMADLSNFIDKHLYEESSSKVVKKPAQAKLKQTPLQEQAPLGAREGQKPEITSGYGSYT